MRKRGMFIGSLALVGIALAVVLLWPAPDPLANVETVAIRVGPRSRPTGTDIRSELSVFLGDRGIRIVSDEAAADVVLEITDFTVNLGNVEISISEGSFSGRAIAVCSLTDVRSGRVHVMDFIIEIANDRVRMDLVPRRFWEFWKAQPPR